MFGMKADTASDHSNLLYLHNVNVNIKKICIHLIKVAGFVRKLWFLIISFHKNCQIFTNFQNNQFFQLSSLSLSLSISLSYITSLIEHFVHDRIGNTVFYWLLWSYPLFYCESVRVGSPFTSASQGNISNVRNLYDFE